MIEAVVQTGTFETRYRRAGSGRAVLLVLGMADAAAGERLFRALASRYRVIAPLPPPGLEYGGGELLEPWLRGLIDGLGLERPALVAGEAYGVALLRFAALDPDRVDRVALVGSGKVSWPDPAVADAAGAALYPVLMVRLQGSDEPITRDGELARLLEFLADPMAPPPQATTVSRRLS